MVLINLLAALIAGAVEGGNEPDQTSPQVVVCRAPDQWVQTVPADRIVCLRAANIAPTGEGQ